MSLRVSIDEWWNQYKRGLYKDREFAVFCITGLVNTESDVIATYNSLPVEYKSVIASNCDFAMNLFVSMIERANELSPYDETETDIEALERFVSVARTIDQHAKHTRR